MLTREPNQAEVASLVAGDEQLSALWEAAEGFRPYLRAVAANVLQERLAGKVDPSDIVQAALLGSVEQLAQFRGASPEDWQAWLVAIVRNEARQTCRFWHQQRRNVAYERPDGREAGRRHDPPCQGTTPSKQALRREQTARLLAAIELLRPADQTVIRLRHFDGFSHAEVAQKMGRSEAAVRQLWVAALGRLRRALDEESEQTA